MNDAVMQLGVGGIFAILMVRETLSWWHRKNGHGSHHKVEQAARRITLENAVIDLAENIKIQTTLFKDLARDMKEMRASNDETHMQIIRAMEGLKT